MKRTELLEALRKVMPGVEEKNALLEGADSFMFDDKWVKTFNNEISASYPFDSGIKCLVKAQEFFKVVSRIESDEIKMIMLDDGKLQLSGGKTTLKMVSSDSSSILALVDNLALDGIKWVKLPANFISALRLTSSFATTDKAYSSLCGVSVARDGLAASDRFRAGFYSMEVRSLKKEIVLPIGAVTELIKFEDVDEFSVGEAWIHFKSKTGLQFSMRQVKIDFPRQAIREFCSVDPSVLGEKYSFPEKLSQSIEMASILTFSNEGSEYIDLTLDAKDNLLVTGAKQYGEIKEKILKDDKWSFPKNVTLKINPKLLNRMLSLGRDFYLKENRYLLIKEGDFESILALVV